MGYKDEELLLQWLVRTRLALLQACLLRLQVGFLNIDDISGVG